MALSPIGFLLLCGPVAAAVLIASGAVVSRPARRLTIGLALIPLVPLVLAFLAAGGFGLHEDTYISIALVSVFVLCVRLHWLMSAMQWRRGWLAHLPLVLLNCALAIVIFMWIAALSYFGQGGHH